MSLINDALKRAKQTHQQQTVVPQSATASTAAPLQPVEYSSTNGPTSSGPAKMLWLIPVVLMLVGLGGWFLWRGSGTAKPTTSSTAHSAPARPEAAEPRKIVNPIETTTATAAKWTARQETETMSVTTPAPKSDVITPKPIEPPRSSEVLTTSQPAQAIAPPPTTAPTVAATTTTTSTESTITGNTPQYSSAATPPPSISPTSVAAAPARQQAPPTPVLPPSPPPDFKLQGIFYRLRNPTAVLNGQIVSIGTIVEGYRVVEIERQSVKLAIPGYTNTVSLY